jgi:hypothetical protein
VLQRQQVLEPLVEHLLFLLVVYFYHTQVV